MDYYSESIKMHKKYQGKLGTVSLVPVETRDNLSLAYSPGVAEPCREIAKDKSKVYDYTLKGRTVAVISDGSAVLGLGNIGPEAGLPVMEGKCVLFKEFAGLDAFPIVLDVHDVEGIIAAVKAIAPTFGGINLEDIASPKCFEIEERLKAELDIPVMHDDQHGTAIVTLAALINSLKVVGKSADQVRVVLSGPGAAGTAVMKLLSLYGFKNIIACDSKGMISKNRTDIDEAKQSLLTFTNLENRDGTVFDALVGADIFIGLSAPNIIDRTHVATMSKDAIIFGMANPTPEIMPDEAKAGGARICGTGRSDMPNQINNVLAFPGIFKGVLLAGKKKITDEMKLKAAKALASAVVNPTEDMVIPNALDKSVVDVVAKAMMD
ncbi:MAG: NADP-dependent malic enzyme [Candidatus Gracilibacteria bacterium]|nr:NADP-dependent malic enzyme [Candidatus Gracilibacteria bacterium]